MAKEFLSPIGRLVQGDCFEMQTKDQAGNVRVVKTGPNAGQPSPQAYIGVAFAKSDPHWPAFLAVIVGEAAASFPALFPQGPLPHLPPSYGCVAPNFAFKIIDGDGRDDSGKEWRTREGFAGHWVVRFTSGYLPKVFHVGHYAAHEQIQDPKALKRGYFVRVFGNVTGNSNAQKPGVYVNFNMVELTAYGAEIISGPDPTAAFATPPAALPAGASATPVAPGTVGPTNAGTATPAPVGAGPIASPPPPPASPSSGPQMTAKAAGFTYDMMIRQGWTDAALIAEGYMVAPAPPGSYTGYMDAPPVAPAAPPPPAAPVRVMLPAANGATYEALIAAGWTDALMVQHGMMAP